MRPIGALQAIDVRPVDIAVALGLAALSLFAVAGAAPETGAPDAATVLLLLLESLPLIVRRRFPLEVMLVVVAATIVHIAFLPADQELQGGLGILVAIYTIGERLDRRTSFGLTALTGVIVAILFLSRAGIFVVLQSLIQTELILGVAWLVGDAARASAAFTPRRSTNRVDKPSGSARSGRDGRSSRSANGSPESCTTSSRIM